MKLSRYLNKTTAAGLAAIAAGAFGDRIQIDHNTRAQLITVGVLAVTGRDTLGKILTLLGELRGNGGG